MAAVRWCANRRVASIAARGYSAVHPQRGRVRPIRTLQFSCDHASPSRRQGLSWRVELCALLLVQRNPTVHPRSFVRCLAPLPAPHACQRHGIALEVVEWVVCGALTDQSIPRISTARKNGLSRRPGTAGADLAARPKCSGSRSPHRQVSTGRWLASRSA
jgi:hypothetical protein